MSLPTEISKYFKKQTLNPWKIELVKDQLFNNIIIIPALSELENIPKLLHSLSLNSTIYLAQTLIVIVVNNTVTTERNLVEENQKLLEYLRGFSKKNSSMNLSIVDVSSKGKEMPAKSGGVGYARKTGMDLSLKLFNYNSAQKKILISLDADCVVSENYLQTIVEDFNSKNLHAAVVNFEHILPSDKNKRAAIINYELFLRYYILGLIYAESHYTHLSVGSIIVCDVESYVKVGGMNKRKAGEDFYFLEKLAKIDKINKVANATVFPSARISNRVPFGTGPRIKRFLTSAVNEHLLYSPKSFEILKEWLKIYNERIILGTSQKDISKIIKETESLNSSLSSFLISNNFQENWNRILNNTKTDQQLQTQKINWMDGFRTLKLIHFLRDNQFPNENMFTALNKLFTKMNLEFNFTTEETIPALEVQIEYLKFLRELT